MDSLTRYAAAEMPPEAPLHAPPQDFDVAPPARPLPRKSLSQQIWRLAAFAPAIALTTSLITGMTRWFATGGVSVLEAVLIGLVGLTFIWVSLSVATVTLGFVRHLIRPATMPGPASRPMDVALLVPVYEEDPAQVLGNVAAIARDLAVRPGHHFTFYILSDTQDPEIATLEERSVQVTRAELSGDIRLFYRRRLQNTDKKVGNIGDWVSHWGAAHEAFVVLDADSLMSARALNGLADALAADPAAGLIQSFPTLVGAQTLFARMQQFASHLYGGLLARGLHAWAQSEGNYWGHNAIIRTRAFAESAQLPRLGRRRRLILSHDFVEAGLLRRAGWAVRFLPALGGSHEGTPPTLIDHVLRDRRWCRGNLQHLRLLTVRGMPMLSRFHLLQGAVAFLLSPAWLALIVIWAVLDTVPMEAVAYFNAANPLYPVWPSISRIDGIVFLGLIYTMLLLPKVLGTLVNSFEPGMGRLYGGHWRFALTALAEIVLSILYAPILMVQQSLCVFRALAGLGDPWGPQRRAASGYGWPALCRFHWLETGLGIAMVAGIFSGPLSVWLAPIAVSLLLAVPLSWLSGRDLRWLQLDSPAHRRPPPLLADAEAARRDLETKLHRLPEPATRIAAE